VLFNQQAGQPVGGVLLSDSLDIAWLSADSVSVRVLSTVTDRPVSVWSVSAECYRCLYAPLLVPEPLQASDEIEFSISFATRFQIRNYTQPLDPYAPFSPAAVLAQFTRAFSGEYGKYTLVLSTGPQGQAPPPFPVLSRLAFADPFPFYLSPFPYSRRYPCLVLQFLWNMFTYREGDFRFWPLIALASAIFLAALVYALFRLVRARDAHRRAAYDIMCVPSPIHTHIPFT
jgi:hypothetical protein